MPNRIIKAGINGSQRLANCSWQAECVFRRMLTCVDDYGFMECTMDVLMCDVIKARRRQVKDSQLLKWLVELVMYDLVTVYTAEHKPFVAIRRWTNKPKSRKPKWPGPTLACKTFRADEIICSTLQEGSCKCAPDRDRDRNRDRLNLSTDSCSEPASRSERKTVSLAQKIYEAYPRHVGRAKALPAIDKAIETIAERGSWMKKEAGTWLLHRVQKFADSPAGKRGTFTPHPTTWMNGGRYDDDDAEWQQPNDGTAGRNAAQGSQQCSQDGGRQRRADKSGRELVGDPGPAKSI